MESGISSDLAMVCTELTSVNWNDLALNSGWTNGVLVRPISAINEFGHGLQPLMRRERHTSKFKFKHVNATRTIAVAVRNTTTFLRLGWSRIRLNPDSLVIEQISVALLAKSVSWAVFFNSLIV